MYDQPVGDYYLPRPTNGRRLFPAAGQNLLTLRNGALALLVLGALLVGLGVYYGNQSLVSLDGEACPAVFGDDRLVTLLTGKDPECDSARAFRATQVYWMLGIGAVLLAGAVGTWIAGTARRPRAAAE
jgi:hypothetical protein